MYFQFMTATQWNFLSTTSINYWNLRTCLIHRIVQHLLVMFSCRLDTLCDGFKKSVELPVCSNRGSTCGVLFDVAWFVFLEESVLSPGLVGSWSDCRGFFSTETGDLKPFALAVVDSCFVCSSLPIDEDFALKSTPPRPISSGDRGLEGSLIWLSTISSTLTIGVRCLPPEEPF